MTMVKTSNNKKRRRILAMLLCLCMVFPKFGNNVAHAEPEGNQPGVEGNVDGATKDAVRVADASTAEEYVFILGEESDGGRYAGRVWSDKSVYTDKKVTVDGQEIENDSDFLVEFSALGSSRIVNGRESQPVDVVLILDVSRSMSDIAKKEGNTIVTDGNGNIQYTLGPINSLVNETNDLIAQIMAANPENRIGIVAYAGGVEKLLDLDHYTPIGNHYISLERNFANTYFWNSLHATVKGKTKGNIDKQTPFFYADSTYLQGGLYVGMKMLVDESNITYNGTPRVPAIIVLSDGGTNAVSATSTGENSGKGYDWWEPFVGVMPTASSNPSNYQYYCPEPNGNPIYITINEAHKGAIAGRTLATLLTAGYMRKLVTEHYGVPMLGYSVGFNVEGLSEAEKKQLYTTLDPVNYFKEDSTAYNAWLEYRKGDTPTLSYESSVVYLNKLLKVRWTYNHPESSDFTSNDDLNYIDKYYDADTADLGDVFAKIYKEITGVAFHPVSTGTSGDTTFTYIDPIGEYMEVKDVKALMLFGKKYVNKNEVKTGDDTTTYKFSTTDQIRHPTYIRDTYINISDIEITVTQKSEHEQELMVKIPSNTLPIRCETVELDTDGTVLKYTTNNNSQDALPFRVLYTVGIEDSIKESATGMVDVTKIDSNYISSHIRTIDGKEYVDFYSNIYNKDSHNGYGCATVTFSPSKDNRYYYFQKNRVIYSAIEGLTPNEDGEYEGEKTDGVILTGTLSDIEELETNKNYYLVIDFYRPGNNKCVQWVVTRTGAELKDSVEVLTQGTDENGNQIGSSIVATKREGVRLGRLHKFTKLKTDNVTGTAANHYTPAYGDNDSDTMEEYADYFTVHLGNNGRLSIESRPVLEVEKFHEVNDEAATVETATKDQLTVKEDDIVTYFVKVSNNGSKTAADVTIEDDVPDGLSLVEGSVSEGGETDVNGHIKWFVGNLEPGKSVVVSFKVAVPAVEGTTSWKNIATAKSSDPDIPDKDSNEVEIKTALLSIDKEQSLNGETFGKDLLIVREDDEVIYKLTVTNISTETAYNVIVTDKIPNGLFFQEASDGGSVENGTITWNLNNMLSGESRQITFKVKIPANEVGVYWLNQGKAEYSPKNPEETDPEQPLKETIESNKVEIEKIVLKKAQKRADSDFTDKKLIVKAGEIVTYQLTVTNLGDADIKKTFTITDEVPEGLLLIGDEITDGGTESGGTITWKLEAGENGVVLAAGKSKTVGFQVQIPEDTDKNPGPWKNIGLVTDLDHPDKPEESNEVEIEPAKIVIEKEQSLNGETFTKDLLIVKAGDEVTYRLRIENVSETTAYNVTVSDKIPVTGNSGVVLKEGSIAPEETGTVEDGVVIWKLGDIEGNGTRTLSFAVTVPEDGSYWKNQGIAKYHPEDPENPVDPDHPQGEEEVESEEVEIEKLSIEKTQSINGGNATKDTLNVKENDHVTYYLTVTNYGEKDAENITITDKVPEGLLLESVSEEGKVDENGRIVWTLSKVPRSGNYVVSFKVTVPEGEDSRIWTNIGFMTDKGPEDPDPTPSNEVAIKETEISIKKAQSPDGEHWYTDCLRVLEGDEITYRLTVTNSGEETAYDVIVTDKIPTDDAGNDLELVAGSVSAGGNYIDENRLITWNLDDLEPGEERELFFKIRVPKEGTCWKNGAFVSYLPPNPENPKEPGPERTPEIPSNEVEIEKSKDEAPELAIRKTQQLNGEGNPTADLLHVQKGDEVTYYLTVTNTSETTAYDVIVKDQIPDDGKGNKLELVEGSAGEGELQGRTITWNIGDLGPGESRTVKFTVKVPAGGTSWKNMASASYVPGAPDDPGKPGPEEDRTPDIPSNEVEIDKNEADITIRKLQSVNGGEAVTGVLSVKPGDRITYRLTVGNKSGSAAEDVIVTDPVPSGLILDEDSITSEGTVETSQDGQQTITWNLGTLEAGGEKILEFQVTVPQTDKETRWTNIAYVTEGDPDPDPEDPKIPSNEVEAVTGIEVEKTQQVNGQGEPTTETLHVQKGDEVTYYLTVTNTSETKAFDVIVTDEIPADGAGNRLELVEGSVEGGQSRKVSGNVITWNIGVLEAGESQTVKFTVKVPADGGSWKNMAGASCVPGDPDDPEKPGPEEDRTPDIPSNEVEIEAGTTKIQLRARKVLNGADLTDGQFTFRIQGISAEITEESENENRKSETAQKPEETEETPEATPSNAERADDEAADSTDGERGIESAGLIKGVGKSLTANVMLQARIMAKGEGIARGSSAVPMPSVSTASNNEDGEIVFGEIEYAAAGIYTYKISEVKEMRSGYTFDTTEYTVEVAVSRSEADGELTAEVRIVKPEGADEIVFTNRYRKPSSGGGSPGGGGGSNPQPGPGTTPDPDPEIPDTTDPENPQPVPDTPGLPDPNDPNSPDTVTIEENGVPRTYVKVWDPVNEEFIYIPEEEVPLFGLLPKTGEEERRRWLGLILALSLAGLGTLTAGERLRRKKEREIR